MQTVKIGKIKDLLKKTAQQNQEKVATGILEEPESKSLESFEPASEEQTKGVLQDLAAEMAAQNRRSLSAYLKDPILNFEEGKLTVILGSKTLKNELEDLRPRMDKLFHARKLKSPEVAFVIDVKKVKSYKPFTAKEQFQAAAEKHPILKDFADRFGLDFDV